MTTTTETMYLSKYALGKGGKIQKVEASVCSTCPEFYTVNGLWGLMKINRDIHHTRERAVAAAEAERKKKIISLEKQIAVLKTRVF